MTSPKDIALQLNVNYYISLASFVVLYYDYFMTLDQEIKFFWNKKLNIVNILFFVNRYLSIFGTVPVILQNFGPWSEKGCRTLQIYHQIFSIFVQGLVGGDTRRILSMNMFIHPTRQML